MRYNIIVCVDALGGIGKNNKLPWSIPQELKHFKEMTVGGTVIMGRKTWESLSCKPLVDRDNMVIGRGYYKNLEKALEAVKKEPVWVIGGGKLYKSSLKYASKIYMTKLNKSFDCDVYFPEICNFVLIKTSEEYEYMDIKYRYYEYELRNLEEDRYLSIAKNILMVGNDKSDRTGVGIYSLFGEQLRFNLRRFPLITTKMVSFRLVAEELLWFISGSTDVKKLQDKNVHIWDGNTTEEFIKSRNLPYREGDMGPMYGFQWRSAGVEYDGCDKTYIGIDQLQNVIDLIRKEPTSRRIIVNSYQVQDLSKMVINPCHAMFQFYVANGKLSCQMYQRSADIFLGVPFNIASYALLTYMVAHITNLEPYELIITYGDYHIYKNHVEQMKEQMNRRAYEFPTLEIVGHVDTIDDFSIDNFVLKDYRHHARIHGDMAI